MCWTSHLELDFQTLHVSVAHYDKNVFILGTKHKLLAYFLTLPNITLQGCQKKEIATSVGQTDDERMVVYSVYLLLLY